LKFKRQQRLSDKKAISRVFNAPEAKVQNASGVILIKSNRLEFDRLVVIVGKKNIKKAVNRSRIKRVVRACFTKNCQVVGEQPKDYVFVARSGAMTDLKVNSKLLAQLWGKLSRRPSESQ